MSRLYIHTVCRSFVSLYVRESCYFPLFLFLSFTFHPKFRLFFLMRNQIASQILLQTKEQKNWNWNGRLFVPCKQYVCECVLTRDGEWRKTIRFLEHVSTDFRQKKNGFFCSLLRNKCPFRFDRFGGNMTFCAFSSQAVQSTFQITSHFFVVIVFLSLAKNYFSAESFYHNCSNSGHAKSVYKSFA